MRAGGRDSIRQARRESAAKLGQSSRRECPTQSGIGFRGDWGKRRGEGERGERERSSTGLETERLEEHLELKGLTITRIQKASRRASKAVDVGRAGANRIGAYTVFALYRQ